MNRKISYLTVRGISGGVKIDSDLFDDLREYDWFFAGGKVLTTNDQTYSEVLDLATLIAGPGYYTDQNTLDHRQHKLKRLLVTLENREPLKLFFQEITGE